MKYFFTFLLCVNWLFAQEKLPPSHIKSVVFKAYNSENQFPILKLGEKFFLLFDDLNAQETDYYYTIEHCDFDWKKSQLLKSEYLTGLDDLKIYDFKNSYSTIQPYTNYFLELPNQDTNFKVSGNYLLKITDQDQNVIFEKRFVIYEDILRVQMQVKQSRNVSISEQKQVVNFKYFNRNFYLENPQNTIKTAILQNFNWQTGIYNVFPQYVLGQELVYNYDKETSFFAGNEYFYFENKDIRVATTGVYATELKQGQFHSYLFKNPNRYFDSYTYNPDINGDFRIISLQGDPRNEAEYSWVYFNVEATNLSALDEVYVYGKFSENQSVDDFKLQYNQKNNSFEGRVFLKQGFYNYKFALKTAKGLDFNAFSGNHYQTENNYVILAYYRPAGALYDRVIGFSSISTTNVSLL